MDLFNDLANEALESVRLADGRFVRRDVAMRFIELLREQEGSGDPAVAALLDRLLVNGATKWISSWMRKSFIETKTKKGNVIDLPAHAGLRNDEGVFEQLSLRGMGPDELALHIEKLVKTRDTYSTEISVLRNLLDLMREQSLTTVGEALDRLAA